jgi:hypothetical protein
VPRIQGTAGQQVVLTTNALTAANGNVLNFAATTGVVVGMQVSGTGIPADTQVVAVTGTTVTISRTSTAGVANATAITFAPDMVLDNASINATQSVTRQHLQPHRPKRLAANPWLTSSAARR